MKVSGEGTKISVGFTQVLMFIVPFLLLINGEIGWIMLYAVVAAHIISAVLFLISVRHVSVEMEPEFLGVREKDDKFFVNVTLRKTGFCLLSDIAVSLMTGTDDNVTTAKTALIGRESVTVKFECSFAECGINEAVCTGWAACDILGLISKRIGANLSAKAAVLPQMKPYEGIALNPKLIPDEDDEEQEETVQNALFGGVPGCEYRGYEAGDSPRKINYKLSAKRREIMVRRDESTVSGTTRIYIKSTCYPDSAEIALAMADEIVRRGGAAEIYHLSDSYRASSQATVEKLREWLAFREFHTHAVEFEDEIFDKMDYIIRPSYETQSKYEINTDLCAIFRQSDGKI